MKNTDRNKQGDFRTMKDISHDLLISIQNEFEKRYKENEKIKLLYNMVKNKTASYREAHEFAIEIGECLAGAFGTISTDMLPDGRMYFNIAEKVINPAMKNNYILISEVTEQVQKVLNERANIGIKACKPEMNQERIDSIINKIASSENFSNVKWMLEVPIVNYSLCIIDDAIRANAEFQFKAGLNPQIVRTSTGKCCDWCNNLAGVYDYEKVRNRGNDVFRRHNNCRCIVEYDPRDGKLQNVHTKNWRNMSDEEARKQRIEEAKLYEEQQKEQQKTAMIRRRSFRK